MTLIPNRGNTKSTMPAITAPRNKIGNKVGLVGLVSASNTSPSNTSSLSLEKNFDKSNPIAMPSVAKIINLIIP